MELREALADRAQLLHEKIDLEHQLSQAMTFIERIFRRVAETEARCTSETSRAASAEAENINLKRLIAEMEQRWSLDNQELGARVRQANLGRDAFEDQALESQRQAQRIASLEVEKGISPWDRFTRVIVYHSSVALHFHRLNL